jgi:hypothetical protein
MLEPGGQSAEPVHDAGHDAEPGEHSADFESQESQPVLFWVATLAYTLGWVVAVARKHKGFRRRVDNNDRHSTLVGAMRSKAA